MSPSGVREGGIGTVTGVPSTTSPLAACPTSDERVALFGLLLETNARLSRQLGAALEDAVGLPLAWFEVLLRVNRAEGGFLSMSALATQTVYSSGGTTRLIDRIEAQGLVERVACANDRRAVHVRLTPAGAVTLERAVAVHAEHLDALVTSKLTDDERDGLETALRKLNDGPAACGG
jgi:MarR family transcriptional regulator, 2-MHQ and catechol-resistance regulon repressor